MKNRLFELLRRFRDLLKKYWYVSIIWIVVELLKDAVFGSINVWLGKQSGSFWMKIEPFIEWAGRQDFSGLSGWIFLCFVGGLLFLSWRDTRSQKVSIGLSGSLEVKKFPGPVLPEKKKPEVVTHSVGDILLDKQERNDGSLEILLTNKRNEVRGPIEVNLVDIKLWSDQFKYFHVVEGYYGPTSPLPMKLEGPNELFPAQRKGYKFWALNAAKDTLVLRDLKKSGNAYYGLRIFGLWEATLKISAGNEEQGKQVLCFEWEQGKPPKFSDCPIVNSVIDSELKKTQDLTNLWNLRRKGVSLRNERISHEEYPEWKNKFESWRDGVLSEAQKISSGLRSHLEVLDQLRQPDLGDPVNSDHERDLRILSEILARLQAYLGERL